MIIRWKKGGPCEHVALWQGHALRLLFVPDHTRAPWVVYVDGRRCTTIEDGSRPACWWTPQAAMEAMDAVCNRIVMEAAGTARATQFPRSEERITRRV